MKEGGRLNYRNRVSLAVGKIENQFIMGLRARDEVISIPDCPVHSEKVRTIQRALLQLVPWTTEVPWTHTFIEGSAVTLVLKATRSVEWEKSWDAPRQENLKKAGVVQFQLNYFPSFGGKTLYEKGFVKIFGEKRAGITFSQVHAEISERIQDDIQKLFLLTPKDSLLDLYCGAGEFLANYQGRVSSVMGVEWNGAAVQDAEERLGSGRVFRGLARERIPQLQKWLDQFVIPTRKSGACLAVLLNPPRVGVEQEVLKWVAHQARPEKLVYQSCSPGTLSRDLGLLADDGYQVVGIQPYDLFPMTHHVEVVVELKNS